MCGTALSILKMSSLLVHVKNESKMDIDVFVTTKETGEAGIFPSKFSDEKVKGLILKSFHVLSKTSAVFPVCAISEHLIFSVKTDFGDDDCVSLRIGSFELREQIGKKKFLKISEGFKITSCSKREFNKKKKNRHSRALTKAVEEARAQADTTDRHQVVEGGLKKSKTVRAQLRSWFETKSQARTVGGNEIEFSSPFSTVQSIFSLPNDVSSTVDFRDDSNDVEHLKRKSVFYVETSPSFSSDKFQDDRILQEIGQRGDSIFPVPKTRIVWLSRKDFQPHSSIGRSIEQLQDQPIDQQPRDLDVDPSIQGEMATEWGPNVDSQVSICNDNFVWPFDNNSGDSNHRSSSSNSVCSCPLLPSHMGNVSGSLAGENLLSDNLDQQPTENSKDIDTTSIRSLNGFSTGGDDERMHSNFSALSFGSNDHSPFVSQVSTCSFPDRSVFSRPSSPEQPKTMDPISSVISSSETCASISLIDLPTTKELPLFSNNDGSVLSSSEPQFPPPCLPSFFHTGLPPPVPPRTKKNGKCTHSSNAICSI